MLVENILYQKNTDGNPFKVLIFNNGICFEKLKAQDKYTFKLIYKCYSPLLYGSIIKMTGNEIKASFVLEHTFLKAWKMISLFDESKCTLFTWLLRIAKTESFK